MKYELGLTVYVGVLYTMVFAKLGSVTKKSDAVTVIHKDTFQYKIWDLTAFELHFSREQQNLFKSLLYQNDR